MYSEEKKSKNRNEEFRHPKVHKRTKTFSFYSN